LGELPSAVQAGGIALAATGIVLIAREEERSGVAGRLALVSVGFGLLTALGFGGFYAAMDVASEGEIPWGASRRPAHHGRCLRRRRANARASLAIGRREVPVVASIGLLIIAANSLYASASTHGLLSVVGRAELALSTRHDRARARLLDRTAASEPKPPDYQGFRHFGAKRCARLKIVVTPVRVRVSPLRTACGQQRVLGALHRLRPSGAQRRHLAAVAVDDAAERALAAAARRDEQRRVHYPGLAAIAQIATP
jgi:hypothetical protein